MARHRRAYPSLRAFLQDLPNQGINQQDFAAELGISNGYLSDLKKGRQTPGGKLALRLSRRCNIPIEVLLGEGVSS